QPLAGTEGEAGGRFRPRGAAPLRHWRAAPGARAHLSARPGARGACRDGTQRSRGKNLAAGLTWISGRLRGAARSCCEGAERAPKCDGRIVVARKISTHSDRALSREVVTRAAHRAVRRRLPSHPILRP